MKYGDDFQPELRANEYDSFGLFVKNSVLRRIKTTLIFFPLLFLFVALTISAWNERLAPGSDPQAFFLWLASLPAFFAAFCLVCIICGLVNFGWKFNTIGVIFRRVSKVFFYLFFFNMMVFSGYGVSEYNKFIKNLSKYLGSYEYEYQEELQLKAIDGFKFARGFMAVVAIICFCVLMIPVVRLIKKQVNKKRQGG